MEIGLHYFKFNIGDYHKKAGRLSMLEHGAYTLLIHACYDREKFPTEEEALDWCWARTDDEVEAVKFVLRKFFEQVDGRFVQTRIQEEIDHYHRISGTNRTIALKRENDRRTNRERTVNEPPPNQEPINQEPLTKNQIKTKTRSRAVECPLGVSTQVWDDYLAVRKAKRSPVTATAIAGIAKEADKAGWSLEQALGECAARGWVGFKAEWVQNSMREVMDDSRLKMIQNTNRVIQEMRNAHSRSNVANHGKDALALRGGVDAEMGGLGPIDADI